ncbi:hypothetical protein [Paractinoplanes brasiliensis]|uniref:Uncharacterized protein n=1 Tax=Paractinoplanes brasiliensis TaxID=52695 RepID=A0A4V3C689_9ACTN|nr:hypothetical protein [Actinoplanes brasiliensis]TDO32748.1 hypothetical protein C8E87_8220 [Actinoplanes brasiliensis]GID31709.1 hypothetical protein Abr02nite_66920 [Actinoplanes brasiliensis]
MISTEQCFQLYADVGLAILRAERGPGKAHLLRVFPEQGATLDEAVAAYKVLTSDGLEGTPAEMELLAAKLSAAGGSQAFRVARAGAATVR